MNEPALAAAAGASEEGPLRPKSRFIRTATLWVPTLARRRARPKFRARPWLRPRRSFRRRATLRVSEPIPTASEPDISPRALRQEIDDGTLRPPVVPQPELAPATTEDETVTVWRFARPPASHHPRPARPPPRRRFPAPGAPRAQPQGVVEAAALVSRSLRIWRRQNGVRRRPKSRSRAASAGPGTQRSRKPGIQPGPSAARTKSAKPGKRREGVPVGNPSSIPCRLSRSCMELRSILESEGKGKKRSYGAASVSGSAALSPVPQTAKRIKNPSPDEYKARREQ